MRHFHSRKIVQIHQRGFWLSLFFFCSFFSWREVKAQYLFDSWTSESGLPQNSVNAIRRSEKESRCRVFPYRAFQCFVVSNRWWFGNFVSVGVTKAKMLVMETDIPTVQSNTGHSDQAIILYYSHISRENRQRVGNTLEKSVSLTNNGQQEKAAGK